MRCQVLDGRLAMALSTATAMPFWHGHRLWARAGLDASVHFGGSFLSLGAYVSHGPETHYLEPYDAPPGFSDPPRDDVTDVPAPAVDITREETRLSFPIGFGFTAGEEEDVQVVLGLVGYYTAFEGPILESECEGCHLDASAFRELFGATITIGFVVP